MASQQQQTTSNAAHPGTASATADAAPGPADLDLSVISAEVLEALRAGELELPLLPAVAGEVLTSSLDEHSDAEKLSELIQQDQSLASHILRVVNSPAFRGASEIVALKQAIARLGLDRIREVALTASLKGTLMQPGPFDALVQENWKRSLACALWTKELARVRRKNVEVGYLCGLLNNVGAPVLLQFLAERYSQLNHVQARRVLAACETEAGVALTRAWQLPELVTLSIEHRDDYLLAPREADAIALTVAGQRFADAMLTQSLDLQPLVQLEAVQFLNLYPEDVEELLGLEPLLRAALDAMCL